MQRLQSLCAERWTHAIGRLAVIRRSAARRAPPPVTKKILPDELAVFRDCGCPRPGQSLASRACLADQTRNVGHRATSGGTHCRENTEHRAFGLALFHLFSELLLAEAKNAATNGRSSRSERNCNTEKRGQAWKQRSCRRHG